MSGNMKLPSIHHLELEADKNKLEENDSSSSSTQKKRKSKPSKYSITSLSTATLLASNSPTTTTTTTNNTNNNNNNTMSSSTTLNGLQGFGNDFMLNYHTNNTTTPTSSTPGGQSSTPSPIINQMQAPQYSAYNPTQQNDPSTFYQQSSVQLVSPYKSNNNAQNYGDMNEYMALSPTSVSSASQYINQSSGVNTPQPTNHSPPYMEYQRSNSFDSSNPATMLADSKSSYYTSPPIGSSNSNSGSSKLTNSLKFSDYDQMTSQSHSGSIYPSHGGYTYYDSYPHPPAKKTHRRRPANIDKSTLYCHNCGTKTTPEWRRGPSGPATLCNACGLAFAKKQREEESNMAKMMMHGNSYSYHRGNMLESYVTPSLLPLFNTAASVPYMSQHSTSAGATTTIQTFAADSFKQIDIQLFRL
eukprot:gene15522-18436_t